ncbi:hypothetical protein ACXZ66_00435 [Corynebacterium sp. S7]
MCGHESLGVPAVFDGGADELGAVDAVLAACLALVAVVATAKDSPVDVF